jgi:nitrogen regulatory protein PII
MHFKLIIAFVDDKLSNDVMEAARKAGSTGATLISQARGEGVEKSKTFFGLTLQTQRDMLLFLVEEHLCRHILETISTIGRFHDKSRGIAFQIDVEDAVGVRHQVERLVPLVEEQI